MGRFQFRVAELANLRTLALAGTLLLTASTTAQAREDRVSFRDFRNDNAELSRREARQQFRAEFPRLRARDAEPINPPPVLHGISSIDAALNNQTARFNDHNRVRDELTRNRSAQVGGNGQLLRMSNGLDLDLTSSQKNISLGRNLFNDNATVSINVGGETKTVGAGSLVSAAEYVAVKQALNGGQTIVVDRNGKASGGEVNLESIATERTALRASNLVVSEGVTTYGDFGRNSEFKLLGDLNNYGTVLAMNSDGSKNGGAIRAVDINNFKGATIRSEVDLTLDASGTLLNYGTIDSTGSLTLSAAGGVGNKGSISASGDLNLQTPSAINRGLMQSTAGNVNLAGTPDAVLAVNNTGGTIQAHGAINVRDAAYSSAFDSHVWGGDLLSSELNMYTGAGTTNVVVEGLTGVVNEYGYAAHVAAATDNLKIGNVCLTGDPTVYNESGTLEITGDIIVGEKLVLLSAGDITSSDNITIRASNASTGFKIELIAGAAFKLPDEGGVGAGAGALAALTVPPLSPTSDVELSGKKSKTGGGVILGQNVLISTRPTDLSGNSNGEVVAVLAFAGKGATAGTVDLSGTTIETGGSGNGRNGSVYVLAGGTKGDVIKTGIIDTTGGTNTGGGFDADQTGVVGIYTVDIVSSIKGQPVTYDSNGNRTSTAFLTGENLSKGGNLIITDTAAPIDINASGFIDLNGGGLVQLNGQVVADDAASNAGSLELISNGTIARGPNGTAVSSSVIFMIAPTIGASDNPIKVDAPDVESFSGKGKINYVEVMGTGDLTIAGTSAGILSIYAPGRTNISADDFGVGIVTIATDKFVLTGGSLGVLENIQAGDIDIRVNDGNITNANFDGPFQARTVSLQTVTGDIGTDADPFTLGRGLQTISAASEAGNIYLEGTEGKLTFDRLTAGGSIAVTNTDSITLANTVTAGGTLSMTITQGTITVPGNVTADQGIILMNTSTNGKIAIDKDVTLATNTETSGNGNITLSVGPETGTEAETPANVVIDNDGTGTVTITGAGVKAKSPVNTLHTEGDADILINNGNKAGNITFGGNVNINAVQTPSVP